VSAWRAITSISARISSALALAFHVGVSRDELQEDALSGAADHDRRMRLLHRGGEAHRVRHGVVLAVQRRLRLRQHAADDPERLVERSEPARHGLEVDAEAPVLELEPAGADAEVEASAAHVIERRRHLRGEARMAVRVTGHHRADAGAARRLGEGGDRRPRLEARPLRIDEDRVEVVEVPERVVTPAVGLPPQIQHVAPRDRLLAGLDAEADRMYRHGAGA